MAFDFPSDPTEGQVFQPPVGPQYVFSGGGWRMPGVAPSDAPLDGNEYVRVNGVWRLKQQTFDMAGKSQVDIPVPIWGPTQARLSITANSANANMGVRVSGDGTTFDASTTYSNAGFYHSTGTNAFLNFPNTADTYFRFCTTSTNADISLNVDSVIGIMRSTAGYCSHRSRGTAYNSNAATLYSTFYFDGWSTAGGATSGSVKALRVLSTVASSSYTRGQLVVEWLA